MGSSKKGLKLAFLASIISGVSVFLNKFAVVSLPDPVLLPAIKNSLVGVLLIAFIFSAGKWRELKKLSKKQIFQLFLVGVVGGFLPFYLFFVGLSKIPAINANLIHKTMVIWVAVLSVPILKERISKLTGFAVLLLFAGNLTIGGFRGFSYSKGELAVFVATVLWAMETILVKRMLPGISPDLIASARMGIGSLLLVILMAISNPTNVSNIITLSPTQWLWISLTAIILLGYVSVWYRALKFASAISVSAVLVSATLVTNILSAIFITKTWNIQTTVQSLLIVLGSMLIYWSLAKHQKSGDYSQSTI